MMINAAGVIALTAGSAAFAGAAYSAASYTITKTLMDIALDHEPPKILTTLKSRISRSRKASDFTIARSRAEEEINGREHQLIKITAADGIELCGHFFPVSEPKRIIVAFHGWRARWGRDFGMISHFWESEGSSMLLVEQRGQNGSLCRHMGFGLTERFDCVDWTKWAAENYPGIPVYLAGISMGGTTVLMAADLDLPEQVHGIMADCAFTSPDGIWRHVVHDNLHLPYNLRSKVADLICRSKIGYSSKQFSTLSSLAHAKVPVLLIHGEDDHFVPVSMCYENYKACATPVKLLTVSGADHGMSYFVNRADYEKMMREFWADHD